VAEGFPLYPRKPTFAVHQRVSATGQKRALQPLFDHYIGALEQLLWNLAVARILVEPKAPKNCRALVDGIKIDQVTRFRHFKSALGHRARCLPSLESAANRTRDERALLALAVPLSLEPMGLCLSASSWALSSVKLYFERVALDF
jgi:hypothetical protein